MSGRGEPSGDARDGPALEGEQAAAYERSAVCMGWATRDGTLLDANPALCRFLCRQRDELVGKSLRDLVHAEDQSECIAAFSRTSEAEPTLSLEARFVGSDDQPVWGSLQGTLVSGDSPRVHLVVFDLSRYKQLEHASQDREALLEAAKRTARMGFWSYRFDSGEIYWSDNLYALYERDPSLGPPSEAEEARYYDPDVHAQLAGMAREVASTGQTRRTAFEVRLPSGRARSFVGSMAPQLSVQGEVVGVMGTAVDVTERVEAERALRAVEEQLAQINDALADAVFSVELPERRVVYANRAVYDVFGYTPEEVVASGTRMFYPSEQAHAAFGALLQETLASQRDRLATELLLRRKGGDTFWASVSTTIISTGGVPSRVISIVRDISEQKEFQRQLAHVQKMEAIGTLAGGIAHDMNNVLAVILGTASVLELELSEDDPLREDVILVLSAARSGKALIERLLGFARKASYEKANVSLNETVRELLDVLSHTFPKRIEVHAELAADLDTVVCDRAHAMQVLLNICLNARDALGESGTIRIATSNEQVGAGSVPELSSGDYVCVEVSDDGLGMNEDTLRRALEPFFTTKPLGKGTGLGLSMAYGFAKEHGGTIGIESTPGKGSTVSLWLPSKPAMDLETELASSRAKADMTNLGVLVVDDEAMVRSVSQRLLRGAVREVVAAPGARVALELLRANPSRFDVVLLDLSMPEMDGHEGLRRLRELRPELPVLVCTGHGDAQATAELRESGAAGVLHKPYGRSELLEAMGRALAKAAL